MRRLFDRYFLPDWEQRIGEKEIWRHIYAIPDEELWNTLLSLKAEFIAFLQRLPYRAHPGNPSLDPNALTIGFARRFAEYKRATLFLDEGGSHARRAMQALLRPSRGQGMACHRGRRDNQSEPCLQD